MSNEASVIDVDHMLSVCQRRCGDHGITVRFKRDAATAYTNGQDIVIPLIKQPITKDKLDTVYGMVIHETGHHLRPEAFTILNKARPPEHLACLFNITEDDGMERERAKAWRGDAKALGRLNALIMDDVGKMWADYFDSPDVKDQDPAPIASMVLGQLSRLEWDDESSPYVSRLIKGLPKPVGELVHALENEGWARSFRATTTVNETWDLAVDLAKRLYPNNPESEYEEIRQAGHKAAKDGSTRDPSQDVMADAHGKLTQSDEDGDVESGGEGKTISWKDAVVSEHPQWTENKKGGGPLGITWDGKQGQGAVLMPSSKVNVVDLSKSKASTSGYMRNWKNFMPTDEHNKAFANRMRRYIQSKARSTVVRDKRHGKLDRGSIVKLALPPIDGGEYNKKIFYEQRKHTMKDTCIFVLVDWSGSMQGSKMECAADATQRLIHTFDRVLNVPVAVAAFSNKKSACDIGYIKPWHTRGLSAERIAKRFAKFYSYMSANNDADSVNWAYQNLRKRKESRKILIVLSDGAPAGTWRGGSSDSNLSYITKAIEKDHRVELYGVGIKSDAVQRYYTNWRYLTSPTEINDTLFNLIKEGDNVKR